MSKKLKKSEIIKRLNERDNDVLYSIYTLRCLTADQIYELHFKTINEETGEYTSPSYSKRKINDYVSYGILELNDEGKIPYYQLTTLGVDIVRSSQQLPPNIFDVDQRVVKQGYLRAYELKIQPRFAAHQIGLNNFLIAFKTLNEERIHTKFTYYDEKFASKYKTVRPDGIISTPEIDFFLEQDMNSESLKQLVEKFRNYWQFLNSYEYKYKDKKIIVLFICDNLRPGALQDRIDIVNLAIAGSVMDKIDETFNIHVDSPENLLDYMEFKLTEPDRFKQGLAQTLVNKGFTISKGEQLAKILNGYHFDYYARELENDHQIKMRDGKLQEYLIDEYTYHPYYVLSKIMYLPKANINYKEALNREMTYIIVLENERELLRLTHDCKVVGATGLPNVLFTIKNRLDTLPLNEALLYVSPTGAVQNFTDYKLSKRHHLTDISSLEEALLQ